MKLKVALVIIVIAFVITAANFGFSLILTRQSLTETMGSDISLALNIANDLVSTRIRLYTSNAQTIAERLLNTNSIDEMDIAVREQLSEYTDFMALTVFDRYSIVSEYGDSPSSINLLYNSKYIKNAFDGQTVISTTRHDQKTGKLVMHICTPMGQDRVLSVTIPGMIFSELLDDYILWDTGHIFMLDEAGTVIAHFMHELVDMRVGYIDALTGATPLSTETFFQNMLSSDKGLGKYIYEGIEYQCTYAQVSASELGWRIALSVPLSESPMTKVHNRIILLAVLFFAFSAVITILTSRYIAKPYNKIAEQNRQLEELNEITRLQTRKIQEAHQRTQLMMNATPLCSMLWDKNGNIFDCNEECAKKFKMKDKQDFLDQFFAFSPEYQPDGHTSRELAAMYINIAFEVGRVSCEWMHKLLDGTQIPCEMTLVRVNYGDDYIVAAYLLDLREHKQMMSETLRLQAELKVALKKAQEANQAKSRFLATMSHEMRTPLNAVVGLSELMLNTNEVQGEVEERLAKIHISGMTLLGIVNDILDISKIESGKFELSPVEYSTPSLINDIISLNTVRIGEKPIQFLLTVDENLPGHLLGDDLRVKQIFNNLLSNAFKYTKSGRVEWKISFEKNGNGIWLVSDVKDTGIGIKEADISKLFQDYSQVDAQTNRKAEGTGLGLSITKRLVDMMDGTISVKSEYRKGSTFSVRLRQQFVSDIPIGKEVAENLMAARFIDNKRDKSAKLTRIDLSYAHVLVVDDMPTNLDVAKGMLIPYGIKVDCATSGQQAIDMVREENPRYDAIFMDHMMPGMDGIEAVQIIREEINTEYAKNIPIIALTANAISGNDKMFLANGFQAFLSKPVDMMRLDSILRQWVRSKDHEIEHLIETIDYVVKQDIPLLGGIKINGVNIAEGLSRFNNNEEMYIKVLESYAKNIRPSLGILENHLESGNLEAYAIIVHGIKGTSFCICASRAGTSAEQLEHWAKAGEKEQVLAQSSVFIEYMKTLLDSIDAALAEYNFNNSEPAASADAPDPALLQAIIEACAEYDAGRVDKVMAELEAFEYDNGSELVTWLRNQVDEMNYKEIANGDFYEGE